MNEDITGAVRMLPEYCSKVIHDYTSSLSYLEEVRMRANKPLEVLCSGRLITFSFIVSKDDIRNVLQNATGYSLYAYEKQLTEGFITIRGGHRIGVCGRVFSQDENILRIDEFSSINIRFAHEIKGCARSIMPYITKDKEILSCLILSPPGVGKTTLLRDICRTISEETFTTKKLKTVLIDERGEIAASFQGEAQLDVGDRTDVLDNCPKAKGIMLSVRCMSPDVIVTDEIGSSDEMAAVQKATCCGIKIIASAHSSTMGGLRQRLVLTDKSFDRYIFISRNEDGLYVENAYERDFKPL